MTTPPGPDFTTATPPSSTSTAISSKTTPSPSRTPPPTATTASATATVQPASPTPTVTPTATSTHVAYPLPLPVGTSTARAAYPLPIATDNATARAPYPLPAQPGTATPSTALPTAIRSLTPTATLRSTATPQPTPAPNIAGVAMNADERKMFAMMNAERSKAGLKPLNADPTFQAVAHARSADMAARKYYSHNDPVTGEMAARAMLLKAGVKVPMGENFYVAWPNDSNAVNKGMTWLMSDPPHRNNILSPRWTVVGVGVVVEPQRNLVIMTQVFGMK